MQFFSQKCPQNAGNTVSESQNSKIFREYKQENRLKPYNFIYFIGFATAKLQKRSQHRD